MTSSLIAQSLRTRSSWADPISDLLEDVSLFEDAVFADPDRWWLLLAIPLGAAAAAYGRRARRRALAIGSRGGRVLDAGLDLLVVVTVVTREHAEEEQPAHHEGDHDGGPDAQADVPRPALLGVLNFLSGFPVGLLALTFGSTHGPGM